MTKWAKDQKWQTGIGAGIVFLSLLLTQFMLPLTVAGKTMYLYHVEFFVILLFLAACVHLLVKREKVNLRVTEFVLLGLFLLWFLVLTVYRYLDSGNITGGFIVMRVMVFPIVLVLLFRQYRVSRKSVFAGLLLFVTCVNVYQIISLFRTVHSFRQLKGLQNINIYLCFTLAALPMIISFASSYKNSCKWKCSLAKVVAYFNIFAIICFSLFSGSRIAGIMCPVVGIGSFFLANGISKKSVVSFLIVLALLTVLICGILLLDVYDARIDFFRTAGPVISAADINVSSMGSGGELQETGNSVTDSNSMRGALWEKSIAYIKENPIFGRSSIDIDCEMHFSGSKEPTKIVQSPHNFILEMWLSLGLPGMLLYLLMVGLCALKILFGKMAASRKGLYLLTMFAVFGFSFFQPLVTSYFAVSLILWFAMYIFAQVPDSQK